MNRKLKAIFGIRERRPGWDRRKAGDAARDEKNWLQADAAYADYLALNPDDAPIWVQRGHAQKEAGNLSGAERCYRRAADIDPRQSDPFFHLGGLMKAMERTADAIGYYRRAAELGQTLAWGDLSRLGVDVDPKSRGDVQSLPWISSETAARTLVDAQAARDLGRWKDAEALYLAYLRIHPNASDVMQELDYVRRAGKNQQRA